MVHKVSLPPHACARTCGSKTRFTHKTTVSGSSNQNPCSGKLHPSCNTACSRILGARQVQLPLAHKACWSRYSRFLSGTCCEDVYIFNSYHSLRGMSSFHAQTGQQGELINGGVHYCGERGDPGAGARKSWLLRLRCRTERRSSREAAC